MHPYCRSVASVRVMYGEQRHTIRENIIHMRDQLSEIPEWPIIPGLDFGGVS